MKSESGLILVQRTEEDQKDLLAHAEHCIKQRSPELLLPILH